MPLPEHTMSLHASNSCSPPGAPRSAVACKGHVLDPGAAHVGQVAAGGELRVVERRTAQDLKTRGADTERESVEGQVRT